MSEEPNFDDTTAEATAQPTRREFVKASLLAYMSGALAPSVGSGAASPLTAAGKESKAAAGTLPMNVVLIQADQLRADCLGCYGNAIVRTPHLDRLAREGVRFTSAFCQHPQCAPSRASYMTGRYPHVHGCISNYVAMNPGELTLAEYLRHNGYQTSAFGKLHLFEKKSRDGFEKTILCGGQQSGATKPEQIGRPDEFSADYREWLRTHGYWEAATRWFANRATPAYAESYQTMTTPIALEAYFDAWVGDRVVEALDNVERDRPFFMFVGPPSPHNPFEVPEPYASMYSPEKMPLPETFHRDLSKKPPHYLAYKRSGRGVYNYENLTAEKLRRIIAYYYAKITLVDDQVGKIVSALERRGLRQNTLIAFISDHGEFLGHHGLLLKSTDEYPMLNDKGLHVPLICSLPGGARGAVVDTPVELVDLFPTIASAAGLPIPPQVQGASLMDALRGTGRAPERDYVFAETSAVKMIRNRSYKLIYYPGQTYGELYNIAQDPLEMTNLHDDPGHAAVRAEMTGALLNRLIFAEAPLHGPSLRGPAYWRYSYHKPFDSRVTFEGAAGRVE